MKLIIYLTVALACLAIGTFGEQQRILRRVIKSTPTATNLGRIRLVTVRSASPEKGAVAEISSKEAASFGQRSANETNQTGTKSKLTPTTSSSTTTTTTTTTPTTTSTPTTAAPQSTTSIPSTTTGRAEIKPKASDRQQAGGEVELLASAPSSWQSMTAVEAPAAMLIASGVRAASSSSTSDLSSASSTLHSSAEESSSSSSGDFLRSSSSATKGSYSDVGATFSRLRQQTSKTSQQQQQQQQQQQSFFYPQQQQARVASKTSNYQATKTHWYQTTTPRPAPIIQEQQYEQQQNEQYVEQQQQVEYGAAPLGQAEPFAFDFNTRDNSGNGQYRKEESDKNGVVRGSYGYTDANGIYRHVEYVADQNGFRANIKSNEPGLIGETQPASIQLSGGSANNQRLSAPVTSNNADNGNDWIASSATNNQPSSSADLALASPDFESSHKPERVPRTPRHFRN